MSSKLTVVALISGGKDSLFAILHCLKNGHDVVALANLHPAQAVSSSVADEGEDLNSFMYQTVGHTIIPLYEHALKLPVYRQPILGHAVNTDKDYHHHSIHPAAASAPPAPAALSIRPEQLSPPSPSSAPRQVDAAAAAAAKLTASAAASAPSSSADADDSAATGEGTVSNTSRNDSALRCQDRRQAGLRDDGETPGGNVDEDEDETESLLPLLQKVLAAHPNVNAVCTGAILSTYQRTRVESVCARLGLVPLGYLWQYPSLPPYADAALLRDMNAVGQDARIIKVASGGVDPGFLWQNVADQRTIEKLRRAAARFGGEGAVLGEGGEFETLAVDGPGSLWKGGKIEVDVDEEVVTGEGGSAVVKFKGARVVEKVSDDESDLGNLRTPDLFDTEFEELGRKLLSNSPEITTGSNTESIDESLASTKLSSDTDPPIHALQPQTTLHDTTLSISNLTAPLTNDEPIPPTTQLENIKSHLLTLLSTHSASPSHITSTTLLLRSMSLFTPLNPIYGSLFTSAPNPPARVTIACGSSLPPGIDVSLSCTVNLPSTSPNTPRRGLHVQSRSYWAPANIGPYSQAVAVPATIVTTSSSSSDEHRAVEIVHLAGQIPLVPASMETVAVADAPFAAAAATKAEPGDASFAVQSVLALQHLWRVGRAMGVAWWACGTAFVTAGGEGRAQVERRARVAREAWRGVHVGLRPRKEDDESEEDDGGVDVWDLKFGNKGLGAVVPEGDGRPKLPDFEGVRGVGEGNGAEEGGDLVPPCVVAQVLELPRAVDIEWTSPGLTGCGDVVLRRLRGGKMGLTVHETRVADGTMAFYAAGVESEGQLWELEEVLQSADIPVDKRMYAVYLAKPLPQDWIDTAKPMIVPCSRVWGPEGNEVAAAVMVRYCKSSGGR